MKTIMPKDRENRTLEALVRAIKPPPATAYDRLVAEEKKAARHRAKILAGIQERRHRLAGRGTT